jgi:hypothetical protein
MSQIKQISRISHHTLTTTGATNFTIPSTEDFTVPNAWVSTDLALSELGVLEGHDKLFIRIDDGIFQIPLSTSTGTTALNLWSAGTGTNTVVLSGSNPLIKSGARSVIAGKNNSSSGENGLVIGETNVLTGNNSAILGGIGITGSSNNTAYVPTLNINTTPAAGSSSDRVLVRSTGGTVNSVLQTSFASLEAFDEVTASGYTATTSATTIFVDSSSNNVTVTLPDATLNGGRKYTVKSTANSAYTVTLGTSLAQTIDNSLTAVLSYLDAVTVVSDGKSWWIV